MGQKVNPIGLRLGVNRTWDSRWYASRGEYARLLHEDLKMREHILSSRKQAGISKVVIERPHKKCRVTVHTARPGILIGKKGAKVDKFREDLEKLTGKPVRMKIIEIHRPELEANLVAEGVAEQLGKRINYRRALKKVAETSIAAGAKGIKIRVAGRLQGSEMARVGSIRKGRVPCTTLRAQLDYGFAICSTKFGTIGCKVWIFKGELGPGETTNGLLPVRPAAEKTVG